MRISISTRLTDIAGVRQKTLKSMYQRFQDSKFSCLVFVHIENKRFGDANFLR